MPHPRVSFVVPVYNVRDQLSECLDSILAQDGDFDVIAVDDASPDDSGAILDDYARADPRIHVLHLDANAGLGGARNAGLAAATGRYVWFVDSDDWLTDGALAAVLPLLRDDPDVVVTDYERAYPDGTVEPNPRSAALRRGGLADLLTVLPVVWNKLYRRDWLAEHGFTFASGYYEDVAWTYPVLVTAERIAVLDRVCYRYRQGRSSSIRGAADRRHFEIFAQYDRVFAYLDAHPELEQWRSPLFDRMLRHFAMLLTLPQRVPPSQKREFFDLAVAAYRRLEPEAWQIPPGTTGIKPRAFARGSYSAFRLAHTVSRLASRSD